VIVKFSLDRYLVSRFVPSCPALVPATERDTQLHGFIDVTTKFSGCPGDFEESLTRVRQKVETQ
jgi:hypothetical protein